MAELKRLGARMMTKTKAVGLTPGGLQVERKGGVETLPADTVVMAVGSRSDNRLEEKIRGLVPKLYIVGDAKEPRNALDAIREGFLTGIEI